MGVRGLVRDVLSIYLGYKLLSCYLSNACKGIEVGVFIAAVILLILAVWFLLERVGVLPK